MSLFDLLKNITTFVFDVDGVLTDGMLTVLPGGIMARRMNVKDGYALQLAIKKGYRVMVISGGYSEEVAERLNKLGVSDVHMRVTNKIAVLGSLVHQYNLQWHEVLYMGDDIPDVVVMEKVGIACCPLDAVAQIKEVSAYISPKNGGYGCVRDVIEKVLTLQGYWQDDTHVPSK